MLTEFYDLILFLIDFALNIEKYLPDLFRQYGTGILIILFLIIFCETGLVVTPFLPGDSLLFLTGTLTAASGMSLWLVMPVLFAAAVLGDTVNYKIGFYFGQMLLKSRWGQYINQKAIDRTHAYFEKYGGSTIIIARFVPLIRTFAPFVAGISRMQYAKFLLYNVVGAVLWIGILIPLGYFLGSIALIQNNLSVVMLLIIFVSVLPIIFVSCKTMLARLRKH